MTMIIDKNFRKKEANLLKSKKKILSIIIKKSYSFFIPAVLIVLWEILSKKGIINQSIMPAPTRIIRTLKVMLSDGELTTHLGVSAFRVVQGFGIGAVLGIIIGILMGLSQRIDGALKTMVGILRPIPIIAWVPLLILWMGIDEASKVTVIAIGSFWPILLNTIHGIKSVDEKYLEVAKILEKSKVETLIKIVFPAALLSIFTGIRLGIGTAWMSVVGAEMIAAATGIGYLIMYARELSQPDVMLVGVFSIGIIGLLIDFLVMQIQNKLLRWSVVGKNK